MKLKGGGCCGCLFLFLALFFTIIAFLGNGSKRPTWKTHRGLGGWWWFVCWLVIRLADSLVLILPPLLERGPPTHEHS